MPRGAPHGWVILDKPKGLGSTQAVAAAKRNLRQAGWGQVKVGHGGTLDPLASGVLPIALGEATKLAGRMLDSDKEYAFTIRFGEETDTLDREGQTVATSTARPHPGAIAAALARFTGPIEQVPPAFSALKVDGRRAFARARAGHPVELPARAVTVHALSLETVTTDEATLIARVSKGTYIRSLARDLALALGTVGHVAMLRRLRAGPFGIDRAISLDRLNELGQGAPLENVILPLEAGLDGIPALDLGPDQARAARQGRVLTGLAYHDGVYWARHGEVPIALVDISGGSLKVVRGFNLDAAE